MNSKIDNDFKPKIIIFSVWRYIIPPFFAVFFGELLVNFLVGIAPEHLILKNDLIETIFLVTIAFPFIYFLSIKPLQKELKEHKQLIIKLRTLSLRDPLTGLYSRNHYKEELARLELGRHIPISIIYIDIDGLHNVNNKFGHNEGDKLLIYASKILKEATRADDTVARIGGDEFVVLLPETDKPTTEHIVERIRLTLKKHNDASGKRLISFSIGSATAINVKQLEESINLADKMMFTEKLQKKNSRV